jgi:hypothetical protein
MRPPYERFRPWRYVALGRTRMGNSDPIECRRLSREPNCLLRCVWSDTLHSILPPKDLPRLRKRLSLV